MADNQQPHEVANHLEAVECNYIALPGSWTVLLTEIDLAAFERHRSALFPAEAVVEVEL